jgi:uncharacterized membrane protein YhdT
MNELKQLKKDWQKDQKFPKINKSEIYNFLHKKSSSIVKWIFIISIIEFSFWCIIAFLIKDNENQQRFDEYGMEYITIPLMITGYIVLFYFFILFYRNYKSISTTVNSKTLMEQILKTRKTVKYYVVFNLIFLYISIAIGIVIELNNNPDVLLQTSKFSESGEFYIFYGTVILITLLAMGVITVFFLIFYYLIYGILLKKLKKNYKELKEIEKQ